MAIRVDVFVEVFLLLGPALLCSIGQGVKLPNGTRDTVFDVTQYGAKADGNIDNSQAFTETWDKACKSGSPAKLLIPGGIFVAKQVVFKGPCKSPIVVEVQGTIKATPEISFSTDQWLLFELIDGLEITGGGTFDGQGAASWKSSECLSKAKNSKCKFLQDSIRFNEVNNSEIYNINSVNSKSFHMHISNSNNLTLHNLDITAPGDSPNTDGIHLSTSSFINIHDSKIGTGDDCISIGQGSMNVSISNIICGPGHGISIGSLGKRPNEKDVMGITVNNCTLSNTTNGVRIKTWPASAPSQASNILFENIVMHQVKNPIIIDQNYGSKTKSQSKPSNVKLSNIHFKNIKGTSASDVAVTLHCSSKVPCENVELFNIDLANKNGENSDTASCSNAKVKFGGTIKPKGCN